MGGSSPWMTVTWTCLTPFIVMAGFIPAIHVFPNEVLQKDMDARDIGVR